MAELVSMALKSPQQPSADLPLQPDLRPLPFISHHLLSGFILLLFPEHSVLFPPAELLPVLLTLPKMPFTLLCLVI